MIRCIPGSSSEVEIHGFPVLFRGVTNAPFVVFALIRTTNSPDLKKTTMNRTKTLRYLLFTTLASAAIQSYAQNPAAAPMFGANGTLSVDIQTGTDIAIRHVLLPDGKLLLAGGGFDTNCNCSHISLLKIDTLCGKFDATFGTGGKIGHLFDQHSVLTDMAVLPNGKILACGQNAPDNSPSNQIGAVYRFNADGSPDLTMNGTAWRTDRFDAVSSGIHKAILPLNIGHFYAVGNSSSNTNGGADGVGIMRFLANGSLDPSFNGDGKSWTNFGGIPFQPSVHSAVLLADSSVLIVGTAAVTSGGPRQLILARFDTDGNAFPGFGTNGLVWSTINTIDGASQHRAFLLADGKILVGASGTVVVQEFLTARFLSSGELDVTYGTNGISGANPTPVPEAAYGLDVLPDGSSLQIGGDGGFVGSYVVKRTPDGQLDTGFGATGVFSIPQTTGLVVWGGLATAAGRWITYGKRNATDMAVLKHTTDPTQGLFADLGPDITDCAGLVLDAGFSGSTYLWSTNATEQTIVVNTSGTYRVAITNAESCTDRDTIAVQVLQLPPVPEVIEEGLDLFVVTLGEYQWYLNGEPIPGATEGELTAQENGSYTVSVTNSSGCTSFSEPVVVLSVAVQERSLEEARIFPNPATDHVYVQLTGFGSTGYQPVSLVDNAGRIVLRTRLKTGTEVPQLIDLSQVVPGCYVLQFGNEQDHTMKPVRIVKY